MYFKDFHVCHQSVVTFGQLQENYGSYAALPQFMPMLRLTVNGKCVVKKL